MLPSSVCRPSHSNVAAPFFFCPTGTAPIAKIQGDIYQVNSQLLWGRELCNTDNLLSYFHPSGLPRNSLSNKISGSSSEAAIESSPCWSKSKWKTRSTFQSSWLRKIAWIHRSLTPWSSFLPVRVNSVACQLAEASSAARREACRLQRGSWQLLDESFARFKAAWWGVQIHC